MKEVKHCSRDFKIRTLKARVKLDLNVENFLPSFRFRSSKFLCKLFQCKCKFFDLVSSYIDTIVGTLIDDCLCNLVIINSDVFKLAVPPKISSFSFDFSVF